MRPHGRSARRAALAVLAGVLSCGMVAAHAAPRPFPTPIGPVSDFAHVIDTATERVITARLDELRQKTGAEIAVVTVETTEPDTAFDYALHLAEAWKPGAPGKDNGVVFLVAVRDREMFIATGYGIEGALPDGLVGEIRDRTVLPRFRAGDVAGGVLAGVERMAGIIAREYGVELSPSPLGDAAAGRARGAPGQNPPLLLMIVLLLVVAAMVMAAAAQDPRRGRRGAWSAGPMWGGGGGSLGGGFGGSGGFGGFGGGSFGGGGAGGKW